MGLFVVSVGVCWCGLCVVGGVVGWCLVYGIWSYSATDGYKGHIGGFGALGYWV